MNTNLELYFGFTPIYKCEGEFSKYNYNSRRIYKQPIIAIEPVLKHNYGGCNYGTYIHLNSLFTVDLRGNGKIVYRHYFTKHETLDFSKSNLSLSRILSMLKPR